MSRNETPAKRAAGRSYLYIAHPSGAQSPLILVSRSEFSRVLSGGNGGAEKSNATCCKLTVSLESRELANWTFRNLSQRRTPTLIRPQRRGYNQQGMIKPSRRPTPAAIRAKGSSSQPRRFMKPSRRTALVKGN